MSKRKTTEEFVNQSNKIHINKYDYSQTNYINNNTKVDIICPIHGLFSIRPNDHLSKKVGCNKCHNAGMVKGINVGKNIFDKFKIKHKNKYDYSISVYINTDTKIDIICPIHGIFKQTPHHHKNGVGCQKCGNVYRKTTSEFISESNVIHNNIYDYSNTKYKNNTQKVEVICKIHGAFFVRPNDHLSKKSGCPKCKISKGELKIEEFLKSKKIEYISQYKFDDCKHIRDLVFDFYLPKENICIEYDGELHFKCVDFFGGKENLKKTKIRDKIKTNYCKLNKIPLIRIKYSNFDDIDEILNKKIN